MKHRLKYRNQHYKTSRIKHKRKSSQLWGRQKFLRRPKAQTMKEKIDMLIFIKIKSFPSPKTVKKMKRQGTDWEKICTIHITDKELRS